MACVDWTISLGNIATLIGFLIGGVLFVFSMKSEMRVFGERFTVIDAQVKDIKLEVSGLSKAMVQIAVQSTRLDSLSERISTIDRRYDELRRGVGFIGNGPNNGTSK